MSVNPQELLTILKILVCVAKADGRLHLKERSVLTEAMEAMELPEEITLTSLLLEKLPLEQLLSQLETPTAIDLVYQLAYRMAYIDAHCNPQEQKLLDLIDNTFPHRIFWHGQKLFSRVLWEVEKTSPSPDEKPMTNPVKRKAQVQQFIQFWSEVNALSSAFPLPPSTITTETIVYWNQLNLIQDIGIIWGYDLQQNIPALQKTDLSSVGITGTRIAINNLAQLLPVGQAEVTESTGFVTTWAIGQVAAQYFASSCQMDGDSLQQVYQQAKQEGEAVYHQQAAAIATKQKAIEPRMKALVEELETGRMTQEEYLSEIQYLL